MSNTVAQLPMTPPARLRIASAVRAHLAVAHLSDTKAGALIGLSQSAMSSRDRFPVPRYRVALYDFASTGTARWWAVGCVALLLLATSIRTVPVEKVTTPVRPVSTVAVKLTGEVTYAAGGDSITAGYGDPIHAPGVPGWASWTTYAETDRVEYMAGWFQVGLRSDQIVDGIIARGVPDVDVFVVMGCTNDLLQGYSAEGCLAQWDRLDSVTDAVLVVSAIAPSNRTPAEAMDYNTALQDRAAIRGWVFVDPYVGARAADGTYLPGAAADLLVDGVHPSIATQEAAGEILAAAILFAGRPKMGV